MKTVLALLLLSCVFAGSHGIRCSEAPRLPDILHIDAGHGMVVGNTADQTSVLSGPNWVRLGDVQLRQVSVGPPGVWGVDHDNKVYKMVGGDFLEAPGMEMMQVAAGGDAFVMGISTNGNRTYCLRDSLASPFKGTGRLTWTSMTMAMKQISCGKNYCWGINMQNVAHYLPSINSGCGRGTWRSVGTQMKMVVVGEDGKVFGLTPDGRVCERRSTSIGRPQGLSWRDLTMCMTVDKIAYDLGKLWITSRSGLIMTCPQ